MLKRDTFLKVPWNEGVYIDQIMLFLGIHFVSWL